MRVQVNEASDRDKRKNNLMVMGLPDGDLGKTKDDIQKVLDHLCHDVEEVITALEFEMVGKPGSQKGPVRIVFRTLEDRKDILVKAKELKKDKNFEKVYIMPDLTKMQQEEDKKLRDKLKDIRSAGESEAEINKGQIVKFSGGHRQVLFELGL